jgi:phosphoribosyl-dephospho-CoA transferase
LQWERRKLALEAPLQDVASVGTFPLLQHIALAPGDAAQVQRLLAQTQAMYVPLRVYGSFGWQHLTGLPCVRPSSDLDLLAPVPDLDSATAIARALQALRLTCRVDGELVFPGGWALAWREFLQLADGSVDRVLVKDRNGVQLASLTALRNRLAGSGRAGIVHAPTVPATSAPAPHVALAA